MTSKKKIIKSFFIIEHLEPGNFITLIKQIKSLKKIKEFYRNTKIDYSFLFNYSMNVTKFLIQNLLSPEWKKVYFQYRELLFLAVEWLGDRNNFKKENLILNNKKLLK